MQKKQIQVNSLLIWRGQIFNQFSRKFQLKMCRACQGKPRVIPFKCYPANGKANLHLHAKIRFLRMESYIVLRHRHLQAEVHTHEHTRPPLFISMSTAIGFLIGYFICHFTLIVAFFVLFNLNKNTYENLNLP